MRIRFQGLEAEPLAEPEAEPEPEPLWVSVPLPE